MPRRLPQAVIAALLFCAGRLPAQSAPAVRVTGRVLSELEVVPADSAASAQINITRAYIGAVGTFEHGVSTRLTLDVFRDQGGALVYRLKHAYLQWRPGIVPVDLRFGMTSTAWIEWQDQLWGYRMQGAQLVDRAGFVTSADLGAAVDYATRDQRLEGTLDVVNGEGYANPPAGNYQDVEGRLSLRLLASDDSSRVGGLRLVGFAHVGKFANGLARDRYIGQLSYRSSRGVLGASYGFVVNDDIDTDQADARLWSVFGAFSLRGTPAALVGRADRLETVDHALGDVYTRGSAGIAWRLASSARVLGDVERTWYLADHSFTPGAPRTRLLFQTEFAF
ncbi:MAG TPA: hypothetical protein VF832_20525 [Longimicrobiales bacterium]